MTGKTIMLVAGEASGDVLAAELILELKHLLARLDSAEPSFFGASGPCSAAAGLDLSIDMTRHSVVGLVDIVRKFAWFRRTLHQLLDLAKQRKPDAVVFVDFSGFNLRLAAAIRRYVSGHSGPFHNWNPKLIYYISPQVWASRPGRAQTMSQVLDLVISIFPFEKEWYARRAPKLNVEHAGHPIVDRYSIFAGRIAATARRTFEPQPPYRVLLLPGSRRSELHHHLPVMLEAAALLESPRPVRFTMVLPHEGLLPLAREYKGIVSNLHIQIGQLPEALLNADMAIASTGTVTMECAFFRLPTVALYKTSALNYFIGKRLIRVPFLAMPNLLARRELFPEFIQQRATAGNICAAAIPLLRDQNHRTRLIGALDEIAATLGPPGAARRAAEWIASIFP